MNGMICLTEEVQLWWQVVGELTRSPAMSISHRYCRSDGLIIGANSNVAVRRQCDDYILLLHESTQQAYRKRSAR